MAERMGLSLRPYQKLEMGERPIRPRHIRLAEWVALDVAFARENLELAPASIRNKVEKFALMLVEKNLRERSQEIASNILAADDD